MQRGPAFLASCIPAHASVAVASATPLSGPQAKKLAVALAEDARGAIYSAVVSIADAFSGLQNGYFSWATVKLYYSCFYLARAALARRGYCVFYVSHSPMSVAALGGSRIMKHKGNSHTVVTGLYEAVVTDGVMNSMPIDGVHAFDWVTERREGVNYKSVRFLESGVLEWFANVDTFGLRRLVGEYVQDLPLYAFDADHAMIALPLAALRQAARSRLCFDGLGLDDTEREVMAGLFTDEKGRIGCMAKLLMGQ